MLAGLSRWIREGPVARVLPIRFRSPLERLTVGRAYPQSRTPLRWTLREGREASVLFGGDLALHRVDSGAPLERVFAGLAALTTSADGFFLNLETQLTATSTPIGTIGSSMRADPAAIGVLSYLGVKGVTCANNHCLDFGSEALSESARRVESAGIAVAGVVDPTRDGGAVVEINGIRLGLLGYTDDWRVSGNEPASARPAANQPDAIRADIRAMRLKADVVVVQLHWGYEWAMYPLRSHRDLARSYVEAGAGLVVCHHAHVPMGIEPWQSGAIAHGLGNLFFGRSGSAQHPFAHSSFVLRAGLSRAGFTDLEVVPVCTDAEGRVGPAGAAAAATTANALACLSARLDRDEYLSRVEESRLVREGYALIQDLARRIAADDRQGARERIQFLEPPRQRILVERLRERAGTPGAIGRLFENLREGRKDLMSPAVMAEIDSAGKAAARESRGPLIGRIP